MKRIILASSSPRRKELLELVGVKPEIVIPQADETPLANESVEEFLRRVTIAKGSSVYHKGLADSLIISSDTIVLLDGRMIGKPRDPADARVILQELSGHMHEVWTGVAVFSNSEILYDVSRTRVYFNSISDGELNYYLENEHYMDKAGAYAIQGKASVFIERIDGCYFNVMGFPLNMFYGMLKQLGVELYRQ